MLLSAPSLISPTSSASPALPINFAYPKLLLSPSFTNSPLISPTGFSQGGSSISSYGLLRQDSFVNRRKTSQIDDPEPDLKKSGLNQFPRFRSGQKGQIQIYGQESEKNEVSSKDHIETECDFEYEIQKNKSMLKSNERRKGAVFIQTMIFILVFLAYFIARYILEQNFMNTFHQGLNHLQAISSRLPNLRYINVFCFEELLSNSTISTQSYGKSYYL